MARLGSFSWNESLDLLFFIRTSSFHATSGSDFGKVSVPVPDPNLIQNLDSNLRFQFSNKIFTKSAFLMIVEQKVVISFSGFFAFFRLSF